MVAEVQPPEAPVTTGQITATSTATIPSPPNVTTTATTATTTTTTKGPQFTEISGLPRAPKRQRRPSVRLGEIGDQPATLSYDAHARRNRHPWRFPKYSSSAFSKTIRARSLTNLVNSGDSYDIQENGDRNGDVNFELGNRKVKAKRAATTKRPRTYWASKVDGVEGGDREEGAGGFRDFDPDSDSPLKEHSPVRSADNVELDHWHGSRRTSRARISEGRENDAVEMDNNNPDADSRDRKCGTSDGVRSFLIELGLSRYAQVFEIHEVDDEVLPMLTLEDLKDMGINAVGSRRKLYIAIQKLCKSFS